MDTSLVIWSAYHAIALIGHMFSQKETASFNFATTLMSWMVWAAMLYTGHDGWFLWSNLPVIFIVFLVAVAKFGVQPPKPGDVETATQAIWAATLRLGVVLACWILA
jgi:hypothetical protein